MLVVVVDTGLGNLRSVEKALVAAAAARGLASVEVLRSAAPADVARADRVVFPGQGAFRDCVRALGSGLGEAILEALRAGKPYLGICLGLQVLFESSAEAPGEAGLGWFGGHVELLSAEGGVKIPHMGWNQLELCAGGHRLFPKDGEWFYFLHSYHAVPSDPSLVAARASYGTNAIAAVVARANVLAVQFHPEKSQRAGLGLLGAFLAEQKWS